MRFDRRTGWNLAPNRFSVALERARKSGRELLDLTESNPTRVGLEYPAGLLRALADPLGAEYRPDPRGLPLAREAVCHYYKEMGVVVPAEKIVLTASTSEAYSFLFRLLCDPSDEVLVAAPSYPLFDFLATIQDVKLVPYPLFYDHGWHIDLHALERQAGERTRAVLLVHPNNPTGSYVKSGEREALSKLCAERGLSLIVDEVFLDYSLGSHPPGTFADHAGALTFTLSGLSKIAALPQLKLSWIAVSGPRAAQEAALERLEVIADTYLSVSTPIQLALPRFLQERTQVQKQIAARVQANLSELDSQLARQHACRRLEVEGGWYAVLRVPAARPDEDWAVELLEREGVLAHPGHFYDFPAGGYLVVSLIARPDDFRWGIARILAVATEEMGRS